MTTFIRSVTSAALVMLISTGAWAQHTGPTSAYTSETDRVIKALSAQDVNNYQNGRGMGLAKAAELNGYPGPMHVLEAEKELGMTADQKARMQVVYEAMHGRAVELGKAIVKHETALDGLFTAQTVTPESLQTTLDTLAGLQGQLRLTHLEAHLKAKRILSVGQLNQYNQLRGYSK